MRKSKIINLTLATSVSAWALASCSEEPKPVTETKPIFSTVAECVAGGNTEQLCQTSIAQAQAAVPKFSAKAQCEAEYGVGNCESRAGTNGGGDWFGPAMAGFFVGQMLSNNGGGNYNRGYDEGRRDEERRNGGGAYARGSAAPVIVGRGGALQSGGRSLGVNATRNASGSYTAPRNVSVTRTYTSSTSRGGFGRSAGARGSVGG